MNCVLCSICERINIFTCYKLHYGEATDTGNTGKVNAKIDANQMKMDENQERMAINRKEMEADRKREREDFKGMMVEMNTKMNGNQAEMRYTVCVMWFESKETIQHEMKAVIQPIRSDLDETTTSNEATETEHDPGMMQSIEEHQENPKGEATVMPVGVPRKWRRVCNLAAECCQKRKERARGKSGSWRKSAAACRKVSCCTKVAW
jgi:hypothetical protein